MKERFAENLAREIMEGDVKAFEVFFKAEFDNIVHFLNNYLHDHFLAKDIAQVSLWTLWEKRSLIDPEKNLRAFAFTIARNRAINELKVKEFSARSIESKEISANIQALGDESLTRHINALDLEELIKRTYENLPETARDSFILSRKYGLTNREIAMEKGITMKAVEYHMKIALKFFRERLKDYLTF